MMSVKNEDRRQAITPDGRAAKRRRGCIVTLRTQDVAL